jgi:hypothetical protein
MEKKQKKLLLKKVTVTRLNQNEQQVQLGGGTASRINCSVTICFGTLGCCQLL